MALYTSGTITTPNALITAIKDFAQANGWTVDTYTESTNYRLHLHKGDLHVDMQQTSTSVITLYGCTAYASGSAYNAQPGASASKTISSLTSGSQYYLVSVVGGIYVVTSSSNVSVAGFVSVQDKIGGWTGGAVVVGSQTSSSYAFDATSYGYAQLYIDGAWTPTTTAGGLKGNLQRIQVSGQQPCQYNATIVQVPACLFVGLSTDGTKLQPVGYAPGLYRCSGGNIYSTGDIITIGSDDYLILPAGSWAAGIGSTRGDYLFKLGA